MNGAWGFNLLDTRYKSTKDLVHLLVRAAGLDSNLLLNVGPMPDGRIQPEFVSRLREIGDWLSRNGESIYGTRGGPIAPRPWGVTTRKGDRVYVHVLDWPDGVLEIPKLPGVVRQAYRLGENRPAIVTSAPEGLSLKIGTARDPCDTVFVLEVARK
jgi:alpha-L-fucosidase